MMTLTIQIIVTSALCSNSIYIFVHVQGVGENELLDEILESVSLNVDFSTDNGFSSQMEVVTKMMKTKDSRGSDRDIFYVERPGFDTHSDLNEVFGSLIGSVNLGLDEFKRAMLDEGLWDKVTIVMVSEFARTLPENTGSGSDHGMLKISLLSFCAY